jgi:glutamyl-tRNA reductase
LSDVVKRLEEFDIVCCATRAGEPVIRIEHIPLGHKTLIFDLGVPRNVDPAVDDLPGVTLFDVDAVTSSAAAIPDEALVANGIEAEVRDFAGRLTIRQVGPIIAGLRAHVDSVRIQEVERIQPLLSELPDRQREAVESMVQRMIDRMFHHLVVRLKLASLTDEDLIRAAEFFFAHGDESLFPEPNNSVDQPEKASR